MVLRSFANGSLFAEVLGEGPPRILALHGWGRRGADFKPSLEGLPALAPDLPGFGASPPPTEVIGASGYADILVEMLDEFDEPPVLVGHSFGGRVAVCLAAQYPDRVGGLVLTGVPLLRRSSSKGPALGYRTIRWLNKVGVVSGERLEAEKRKRGSSDYRAATGVMRDILVKVVNESYEDELVAIRQDVTLLWGIADKEAPYDVAIAARDLRESAGLFVELRAIEGEGHMLPLTSPQDFRGAVEKALR